MNNANSEIKYFHIFKNKVYKKGIKTIIGTKRPYTRILRWKMKIRQK